MNRLGHRIRVLSLKKAFDLNYSNHRMADVSQNELQCRLIFLIRLLKVDTLVCWDPWAHDELIIIGENQTTSFPASAASFSLNGQKAEGDPWRLDRSGKHSTTACLAWCETWFRP